MQKIDEALMRTARSRTPTACLQCQKRKQKCSREQPCRHCSRRYPPVECIYTFEGRHRMVQPPSPNKLSVPDDTPASLYTDSKTSPSRFSSTPPPQNFLSRVQNHAFHEESDRNPQGIMSFMNSFVPTSSESYRSKSLYQAVSSSAISPGSESFAEIEMDSNELDHLLLPQVPTNTPSGVPDYNDLGAPTVEGERWNQNPTQNMNSAMENFQRFDQSYIVPLTMQTEHSQLFVADESQAFNAVAENNGMRGFGEVPDISLSQEGVDDENRNSDYGTTGDYSGSFY